MNAAGGRAHPLKGLWLSASLFLATCGSTFVMFWWGWGGGTSSRDWKDQWLGAGLFSASVMSILLAHEMGHWLMARHHRVPTSFPYFIPAPLGFGTLGAVMKLRGRIPNRNALIDIGAAGPLAGLLIALPLSYVGMKMSHLVSAEPSPPMFLGTNSLAAMLGRLMNQGPSLELDSSFHSIFFGDSLYLLLLQRLVFGSLPPGTEVAAHPVFVAAWFGFLVTVLNLIPVGQLDGGHVLPALRGPRARWVGKASIWLLLGFAVFFSVSWLAWVLLASFAIGFSHPPVVDPTAPLSSLRVAIAWVCMAALGLLLMPVPIGFGA